MKKESIILIVVIILIVGSIYYLEGGKIMPTLPKTNLGGIETIYPSAPELTGISGYLNTEEGLQIADLKGKVVLIDFWTYTCINCIRTLPHLVEWDKKYRDKGLVIIGVHTPEFNFEKKYENVKKALEKYNIEYAVVQDNDYATWKAFRNRYWPHKYLIDGNGQIRYDHIGEGAYKETELMIQKLLAELGEDVSNTETSNLEDKTPRFRQTPELYAGYDFALDRGQNIGNEGGLKPTKTIDYKLPGKIIPDTIYLDGKWQSLDDNLQARDEESAAIVLDFIARNVNIVADSLGEPLKLQVFINEEFIKEEQAGTDVVFENGEAFIIIDDARLYNVVKGDYGRYILRLFTTSDQFNFNAFTFG